MTRTIKRLEEYTRTMYPNYVDEECTVHYRMCPLCGEPQWIQNTDHGMGFRIKIENTRAYGMPTPCFNCENVTSLNPDLTAWIMKVLTYLEERRENGIEKLKVG